MRVKYVEDETLFSSSSGGIEEMSLSWVMKNFLWL